VNRKRILNILIFWEFREKTEDGKELHFDQGAPLFSVSKSEVLRLVQEWESRGLVAEWKEKFGSFDFQTLKFNSIEQVVTSIHHVFNLFMQYIWSRMLRQCFLLSFILLVLVSMIPKPIETYYHTVCF
jgi:hypothetical protein